MNKTAKEVGFRGNEPETKKGNTKRPDQAIVLPGREQPPNLKPGVGRLGFEKGNVW